MGNLRERHNAKARKSRPGKRPKHSHNSGDADTQTTIDPNADIVNPKSKEQREADRRERLRQEVSFQLKNLVEQYTETLRIYQLMEKQAQSKFTSKKKKRLEKYIVCHARMYAH